MTIEELKTILHEDYRLRWHPASLATQYVRGERELNPVKEWEDGMLELRT
jgi:hypothetical protein